jgi:hypothetical protein
MQKRVPIVGEVLADCSPMGMVVSRRIEESESQRPVDCSSGGDHNFISKLSNRKSEYEETPNKFPLCDFPENAVGPCSGSSFHPSVGGVRQCEGVGEFRVGETTGEEFRFEVEVVNAEVGRTYWRRFTTKEYGAKAVEYVEEILLRNM